MDIPQGVSFFDGGIPAWDTEQARVLQGGIPTHMGEGLHLMLDTCISTGENPVHPPIDSTTHGPGKRHPFNRVSSAFNGYGTAS